MGSDSEDTVHSQNITFMYCWRRIQLGFEGWNGKYDMDLNTVHINLCTYFIILLKVEVIRDYMFQNEKSSNAIRISLWYLSSKDIFQIKTKIIQQNICPHLEWWLKYILLSEKFLQCFNIYARIQMCINSILSIVKYSRYIMYQHKTLHILLFSQCHFTESYFIFKLTTLYCCKVYRNNSWSSA